jgi:hypothetical protein
MLRRIPAIANLPLSFKPAAAKFALIHRADVNAAIVLSLGPSLVCRHTQDDNLLTAYR